MACNVNVKSTVRSHGYLLVFVFFLPRFCFFHSVPCGGSQGVTIVSIYEEVSKEVTRTRPWFREQIREESQYPTVRNSSPTYKGIEIPGSASKNNMIPTSLV